MRGPECCRWDAEWQPTGAAAPGGRAKWLSYPGDCEHTTSLNKSASLTLPQPDTEEMKDLLYLSYQMCALHLQRPSVRVCVRARVRYLTATQAVGPCALINESSRNCSELAERVGKQQFAGRKFPVLSAAFLQLFTFLFLAGFNLGALLGIRTAPCVLKYKLY